MSNQARSIEREIERRESQPKYRLIQTQTVRWIRAGAKTPGNAIRKDGFVLVRIPVWKRITPRWGAKARALR